MKMIALLFTLISYNTFAYSEPSYVCTDTIRGGDYRLSLNGDAAILEDLMTSQSYFVPQGTFVFQNNIFAEITSGLVLICEGDVIVEPFN